MKTLKLLLICFLIGGLATAAIAVRDPGGTFKSIKRDGVLKVGVRSGDYLDGFGFMEGFIEPTFEVEDWAGMEPDFARAIAAAIGVEIKYVPVGVETRFSYLDNKKIDVTLRAGTYTSQRDISIAGKGQGEDKGEKKGKGKGMGTGKGKGYEFGPVYYYDRTDVILHPDRPNPFNIVVAQGSSNQKDLKRLKDCSTCKIPWVENWEIVNVISDPGLDNASSKAKKAFVMGEYGTFEVHGYCGDATAIAALEIGNKPTSEAWEGPQFPTYGIGKSPLCAIIKDGDEHWAELVSSVFYVLIAAEEQGFDQYVGMAPVGWLEPAVAGLDPDWSEAVIGAVGNYGEIWERNIGIYPEFGERGLNALWNAVPEHGLMYAPPFF